MASDEMAAALPDKNKNPFVLATAAFNAIAG